MKQEPLKLHDLPNEWVDAGDYVQRWVPGAFGERADIAGVIAFRVLKDEWDSGEPPRRTILKAVVVA